MRARLAAFIALVFGAVSLVSAATASPAFAKEKDCPDFDHQARAQKYVEDNGGGPPNAVDGLDADEDGIACESLPCPCSDGGGGAGGRDGDGGKKQRVIKFVFKNSDLSDDHFDFKGLVKPVSQSKHQPVKLLRATCNNCKFQPYRSTRSDRQATYKFKNLKKDGCYRVRVPASKGFAHSYSKVICTTSPVVLLTLRDVPVG